MDAHDPFDFLNVLDVDLAEILHGEQSLKYHGDICAGDRLTYRSRISDIYEKKGGALEFVVQDSTVTNQNDDLVAELRRVIVVRS